MGSGTQPVWRPPPKHDVWRSTTHPIHHQTQRSGQHGREGRLRGPHAAKATAPGGKKEIACGEGSRAADLSNFIYTSVRETSRKPLLVLLPVLSLRLPEKFPMRSRIVLLAVVLAWLSFGRSPIVDVDKDK